MPVADLTPVLSFLPEEVIRRLVAMDWPTVHRRLSEYEALADRITTLQNATTKLREEQDAIRKQDSAALSRTRQEVLDAEKARQAEHAGALQTLQASQALLDGRLRDTAVLEAKEQASRALADLVERDRLKVLAEAGQVATQQNALQAEWAKAQALQDALSRREQALREKELAANHQAAALTAQATALAAARKALDTLLAQGEEAQKAMTAYLATKTTVETVKAEAEALTRSNLQTSRTLTGQAQELEELRTSLLQRQTALTQLEGALKAREADVAHRELVLGTKKAK